MNIFPGLESLQNLHPLFVHFPIALILVTLLFEGLWWISKKDQFRVFATYLLYLSALSAMAAVLTGHLASEGLGHDAPGHEFVHEHRDIMYWMTGLILASTLLVIFLRSVRTGNARRLLIVPLLVIGILLIYGTDKGGRLVFEFGMGIKTVSEDVSQEDTTHEQEKSESTIQHEHSPPPDMISHPEETSGEPGHKH